ncbi:calcium/proton exchanger [Rhizoctonia solani 123E]|uniref:Calcium/proton exchanger n=1 Tax=Rhizoctonia solani 123E TaxID=1423351 RepID=A0A074S0G9_9AGAM|nr:calcium/proton exchanger [Rhizoctonia solani 123E]
MTMETTPKAYRSNTSLLSDVPLSHVTSTVPLVHMPEPPSHHHKPQGCPDGWWGSLVWRLQGGGKPVPGWWDSYVAIATSSWLNILLINVPLAWTAALLRLNPLLIFGLSFLAIVPLEKLSEFGGSQFALYCGETLGEFVSITLANIVEVNLAIFLLFQCELRLVQSTVIGVILLHALLVPGIAFMVGGARVLEQKLKPVHTQLNASLLFLGVVTLLLPVAFFSAYPNPHELVMANATHEGVTPTVLTPHTHAARAVLPTPNQLNYIPEPLAPPVARHARHAVRAEAVQVDQTLRSSDGVLERNPEKAEERYLEVSAHSVAVSDATRQSVKKFSRGYAMMMIAVYILSRIYLHRHPLNDDLRLDRRPDIEHTEAPEKPIASGLKRKPRVVGPGPVIVLLIIVVGLVAVTAEFLVSSVEHVQQVNQLSSEWFGLILLPMISYSADALVTIVYCCRKAFRHHSDTDDLPPPEELARGRSIDLSIQFLLFWLPVLVILAWITGKPLTLLFDVFEVAAAIGACLLVNYTTQDGKTNWVEGFLLITFYFMIALAAWFYNGQLSVFELLQCQSVDELVRTGEMGVNI